MEFFRFMEVIVSKRKRRIKNPLIEVEDNAYAGSGDSFLLCPNENQYKHSIYLSDAEFDEPFVVREKRLLECSYILLIEMSPGNERAPGNVTMEQCKFHRIVYNDCFEQEELSYALWRLMEVSFLDLLMSFAGKVKKKHFEKNWGDAHDSYAISSFYKMIAGKAILLPVKFLK